VKFYFAKVDSNIYSVIYLHVFWTF